MASNFNKDACQEAYEIVNFLLQRGEIVVPNKIMDVLENNRNTNHKFDLNDIQHIKLHPETELILTAVYIECMTTEAEKNKISKAVSTLQSVITKKESSPVEMGLTTITFMQKLRAKLRETIKVW